MVGVKFEKGTVKHFVAQFVAKGNGAPARGMSEVALKLLTKKCDRFCRSDCGHERVIKQMMDQQAVNKVKKLAVCTDCFLMRIHAVCGLLWSKLVVSQLAAQR